ncbi:hypothetical protein AVEN_28223-1 [Araneus ventricosus]|uniref:Uncharacterized protein n=1 Tax=Araneus ventricosus TaxID=182803 RepID=A0A4Y2V0X5_ARAVE|nr:hypothetical protein AVEN_225431-1 [Araneus ventricosus]GBO18172.1 hypothetical protein AVEN_28223-1 [Araneus ventricosus]
MRPFSRYLYYERKCARMYEKTPYDVTACRGDYIRVALGSARRVLIRWNDFGVSSTVRSRKPEEYGEWMSIDDDIPVAAALTDLEIRQAVCKQDQAIEVDDSDWDQCVIENPPTNEASS